MPDTKTAILDAAERLFTEHGFHATSLRDITSEAGVNLAAVNYHFRSKHSLIGAVIARRLEPINRHRLEMLDEIESEAGHRPPAVERVIEAFARPILEGACATNGTQFAPLLGRMYTEPKGFMVQLFNEHLREVARRFQNAFERALPDLPSGDLFWRLHLMIGGLAHTLAAPDLLRAISGGQCNPTDVEEALHQLTVVFATGLRASTNSRVQRHKRKESAR
jgi:AcrR family transcriptional regulator